MNQGREDTHELWSADDMMPPSSFLTLDGNRRDLTRSIDDIVTGLLWIDSQGPQGLEENNYEQFFANGDALRQAREFFDVESGTRSGPYLKNIKKKEANGVKGADFANILTSELLLPMAALQTPSRLASMILRMWMVESLATHMLNLYLQRYSLIQVQAM